ncbi:MAG: hypothetical protein U5K69_25825 [Balneolaceae bacterium]|nr:hypothetical protein [Balneolaceae bacterium]
MGKKTKQDDQPFMIIGSDFSDKSKKVLLQIGKLSEGDADKKLSVQKVNEEIKLDRTEIKNFLEYLKELGYIKIITIGGPLLYGHIKITEQGLEKIAEIKD